MSNKEGHPDSDTYSFSQDQAVLHEVHHICVGGRNMKQISCSQTRVDWVVQHPGEDAVEAHHTCQCPIRPLCQRTES